RLDYLRPRRRDDGRRKRERRTLMAVLEPLPLDVLVALALQGQHVGSQMHRVRPGERPRPRRDLPREPKPKLRRRGKGLVVFSRDPDELDRERDRAAVEGGMGCPDRRVEDSSDLRVECGGQALDPDGGWASSP